MMSYIRRYFISGLLVWVPIWVTILVIKFLADLLANIFGFFPKQYQPDTILGFHIPGIEILIILLVIILTGAIAANFLGSRLVAIWDAFVSRIPLVRTVHMGVKQIMQTLFSPGGQSFRKVLLVEYPREGVWTLAFQTGDATAEVQQSLDGEPLVGLFVPTTPNPTSGFLLMVPKKKVIELNMSIEQALKYVISLGVMQPNDVKKIKENAVTKGKSNA